MMAQWLVCIGAVQASAAIALAAYASHAVEVGARQSLFLAAIFAFGHGVALTALAPHAWRRLGLVALGLLALGCLLFSVSLAGAHFLDWPTRLAPAGGSLMILAWLMYAIDAVRR